MSQQPPDNPYGQQPPATPYGQQPPANPYGQQPPPNPYGQPPAHHPGGQPPVLPPGQPPVRPAGEPWKPPRRGRSNVFKFWMGVLLCLPALFVAGALQAVPRAVGDALSLPPEVGQFSTLGLDLGLFVAFIAGLVVEKTRFIVLGIIAGVAVLFVVAASACILLLAGLASGY